MLKILAGLTFWLGIFLASLYGWVHNIIEIFGADFSVITGELVLRLIGIFIVPIGIVMGYV